MIIKNRMRLCIH